ncbi:ZIP family metal transporter [Minwuia thermotolerans]|nr:ZIP family metal transporter [Minwuia thermotolerans]
MPDFLNSLAGMPTPLAGFLGSLAAGLMSGVGAVLILLVDTRNERAEVLLLGFSAGVMLAATSFSLIVPGVDAALAGGSSAMDAAFIMAAGLMLGGVALWLINAYAPHEHFVGGHEGPPAESLSRMWLFVIAITLHNFPEGLAVGVGFGGDKLSDGVPLAAGIGLQNIPEGFVVALALASEGYSRSRAIGIGLLTGLVEPVGGLVGAAAVTLSAAVLPWGMAFAAGAMLFVISGEMIPETHREKRGVLPTFGILIGFAVMMVLDIGLG